MIRPAPSSTLFPYTTLFRSRAGTTDRKTPADRLKCQGNRCPSAALREGGSLNQQDNNRYPEARTREPIGLVPLRRPPAVKGDRKSTRLNSSHGYISYAVFCL